MNKLTKTMMTAAALLLGSLAMNAQAAIYNMTGVVTGTTGAFDALTPAGTPVAGPLNMVLPAGVAQITSIDVNVGGFCFSTETPSACPLGGADVPITSIDGATLFDAGAGVVGGTLDVTAFSPTFGVSIPIMFDFDLGTFAADGGALGTVVGTMGAQLVPVPAAAWLFGSALLGLAGIGRKRKLAA